MSEVALGSDDKVLADFPHKVALLSYLPYLYLGVDNYR